MEAVGTIYKIHGNKAIIIAEVNPYLIEKQNIKTCLVKYDDGRVILADQRRKIYALINDISEYTGYNPDETKEVFKKLYAEKSEGESFSLSDCSITTARKFISFLIKFCVENEIPTKESLIGMTEEVGKYLYACVAKRKCAICGKSSKIYSCSAFEVGNVIESSANIEGSYVLPLCQDCRSKTSDIITLYDEYKIKGIKLDAYLSGKLMI